MSENETVTASQQPTLKLGGFEGPLDLLLHLIREAKMDIYDIKIATITSQYMDYLHQMKAHRLEIAGEYFVMASTLMRIKSQLLLPQAPPLDDEEPAEEPVDPRQELVDQLIEYQRYKKAADHLKDKESYRQQEYTRPAMRVPRDLVSEQVAPGVSLDQLQAAFAQVLKRHRFIQPAVTKDELVTTFLAILELAKHQAVHIEQAGLFAPIIIKEGLKSDDYRNNEYRPD